MLMTIDDCHNRIQQFWLYTEYKALYHLPRGGWIQRQIPNPETVGEHSIITALVVMRFKDQIAALGLNILTIQDTLLIHDIAESDISLWDLTPHDGVRYETKQEQEENIARSILEKNPYLMKMWLDYEYGRSSEWKIAKELDKMQAIEKAFFYENLYKKEWLMKEFYEHSVIEKNQIQMDFLKHHIDTLYQKKI